MSGISFRMRRELVIVAVLAVFFVIGVVFTIRGILIYNVGYAGRHPATPEEQEIGMRIIIWAMILFVASAIGIILIVEQLKRLEPKPKPV
jgi:hypothetical protein